MRRVWSAGSAPGGAHSSTGPLASGREVGEVSDDGRGMGLRSRVRYLTPLAGGEGNWTTIGAVNGEGQSQTGAPWFVQVAEGCGLRLVGVIPSRVPTQWADEESLVSRQRDRPLYLESKDSSLRSE